MGAFPHLSRNVPFCPRLSSFVPICPCSGPQEGQKRTNGVKTGHFGTNWETPPFSIYPHLALLKFSAVPKRGRFRRGRTQKHANNRKRAQTQACKRAQKGAKERFRVKIAKDQVLTTRLNRLRFWKALCPPSLVLQNAGQRGNCDGFGGSAVSVATATPLNSTSIFRLPECKRGIFHGVLQGAPPRGRQFNFTFPSALDPLCKASKAPFLTL